MGPRHHYLLQSISTYRISSDPPLTAVGITTILEMKSRFRAVKRIAQGLPGGMGFHCGSVGKESTCNAGHLGSIPGLERSPSEGKGYLLQYSSLENSMDWIVHGVAKSWTLLSDFHFPGGTVRTTCQCRGHEFNPWSGKNPHVSEQLNSCTTTTETMYCS